jgi:hypothetical protein
MSDGFLHLGGEDEADLDDESRQILEGVRHLCSLPESGLRTQKVSATREERHLRLRLQRSPEDWVDLLVGDGYAEFSRSDEKTYAGYLTPQETVARVRAWMLD